MLALREVLSPGVGGAAAMVLRSVPWMTVGVSVCLLLFALRKAPAFSALAACLIFWAVEAARGLIGQSRENAYQMPVAVLFTFAVLCFVLGSEPEREEAVWDGCCGTIGALYTMAGLSKLRASGFGWINGYFLRVLSASQLPWSSGGVRWARALLAGDPKLAYVSSAATLSIELCGVLMVLPKWRSTYVACLLGLHLMIYLGTGILWPHNVALFTVIGLGSARPLWPPLLNFRGAPEEC